MQELAWASYALLRNTNSRGMIVATGGKIWVARGAMGTAASEGNTPASLAAVAQARLCIASVQLHLQKFSDLQAMVCTPYHWSLALTSLDMGDCVQALKQTSNQMEEALAGKQSVYLPNEAAVARAGVSSGSLLPQGCASMLIQALYPLPAAAAGKRADESSNRKNYPSGADIPPRVDCHGFLLLWSDKPRALSQRERLWATALAAKLQSVLI